MDPGVPLSDLVWPIATLMAGGAVVGLLSGLLGIGGGGILVPILYEAFGIIGIDDDVRMHLCIGTSLAVIVPTSLRSYYGHYRRGAVDTELVRDMTIPIVLGVGLGSLIASVADSKLLTAIWVACAALMAVRFMLGTEHWRVGGELPGLAFRVPFGLFIGTMSSLMGIGAAAFMTTWMSLYGKPLARAVGTASGFGLAIAFPGTIGFIWAGWGAAGLPPGSLGYVSVVAAAIIIPVSVLAAPYGVRMAHGVPKRLLELGFAIFLSLIAVRLLLTLG